MQRLKLVTGIVSFFYNEKHQKTLKSLKSEILSFLDSTYKKEKISKIYRDYEYIILPYAANSDWIMGNGTKMIKFLERKYISYWPVSSFQAIQSRTMQIAEQGQVGKNSRMANTFSRLGKSGLRRRNWPSRLSL